MKRRLSRSIIAIILTVILLFTATSCSTKQKKSDNQSPTKAAKTEFDNENFNELVSNSSLDQMNKNYLKDAVAQGQLDGITFSKLEGEVPLKDVVGMLENVIKSKYGTESKFLKDYMNSCKDLRSYVEDGKTTRMNLAELIFYTSSEIEFGIKYKTFSEFILEVNNFWGEDKGYLNFPNSALMGKSLEDGSLTANGDIWGICTDIHNIDLVGNSSAANYVLGAFDRSSAERIMTLDDQYRFLPNEKVDFADAILAVYHYSRWLMVSDYKKVEDAGTYDKTIITDELLQQTTTLPDATCKELPAWKGYNIDHLSNVQWRALSGMPEMWVFESDIKTISETGANFANVRVGWGSMSAPDYPADDIVNMAQIKQLDRILAWGIKYQVHIQFCFTEGPGMKKEYDMEQSKKRTESVFTDESYRDLNVRYWRMLAKRYASIPNNYLSFCLMNECSPKSDKNYSETMAPIISAIRDESPERVIVADVHSAEYAKITGVDIAKLGVALCAHLYDPNEVFVIMNETMKENPKFYSNLKWPYTREDGTKFDGKLILDLNEWIPSVNEVKATAEKYGVGFMVGEFGFFGGDTAGEMIASPIPRETIYKIMSDVINNFDKNNIPWCTEYRTEFSLTNSHTIDKSVTYEMIPGSCYYLDRGMFDFYSKMIKGK